MDNFYTFRYSHMVQEYFVGKVRELILRRVGRVNKLKTRKQAEEYILEVRRKIRKAFCPFPKKTALKPEITGTLSLKKFDIEKIIFQSRPGLYVTGNLYLPKNKKKKNPCVLGLCGHSELGKADPKYQAFCQALVRKGFVVFIIDPISQGERRQFFPRDGGKRPGLCIAHNLMGNKMILTDDFFGTWRVWDAIRALDYLLSRDEVDTTCVGVTGNSGGGTLTTYVTALDERITMSAPSCYITSWLANLENELPADAEQNPPGFLNAGFDMADMLLSFAPKPTLILGQHHDFFYAKYTKRAAEDLRKIYKLLGKEDMLECFIGPRQHGYFPENRQAMVSWFMKHAGIEGDAGEEEINLLTPEELNVTASGVIRQKKAKRVFEFTAFTAAKMIALHKNMSMKEMQIKLIKILNIPEYLRKEKPHFRVLCRYASNHGETLPKRAEFAVETEPGIQIILSVYGKQKESSMHLPKGNITVYLGHISSYHDILNMEKLALPIDPGQTLITLDPRGMGQSLPKTCASADFFHPYGADYMYAAFGEMMNKSYLGQRVFDVLSVLDLLYSEGAGNITLVGRGINSVTALFAGFLHNKKPNIILTDYLPSYKFLIDNPLSDWPLSVMPRGILKYFDIPTVYRKLGKRLILKQPASYKITSIRRFV